MDERHTFDEFYTTYFERVRALAARRFPDAAADDVAQDVMVRAYRHFDTLRTAPDAWPWLVAVTRNVGVNAVRASRRLVPAAVVDDRSASIDLPAASAVAGDTRRRLGRALAQLSERDRAALVLRDVDGESMAEIARRLGGTENSIRQRLFRARRALAREYRALGGERLTPVTAPPSPRRRVVYQLADVTSRSPVAVSEAGLTVVVAALAVGALGGPARDPVDTVARPVAIRAVADAQPEVVSRADLGSVPRPDVLAAARDARAAAAGLRDLTRAVRRLARPVSDPVPTVHSGGGRRAEVRRRPVTLGTLPRIAVSNAVADVQRRVAALAPAAAGPADTGGGRPNDAVVVVAADPVETSADSAVGAELPT